ncbi:mannose-1-phosphate guanylyltransferase [Paenibacillaceae bacterium]|nr:mannose-1-phosphate guanylyltransferase [Paenibacillaceae bacterium]
MKIVIMAGGKGTRFWPRSVEKKPKQFLPLASETETMLQQTYWRFRNYVPAEDVYVVAAAKYVLLVKQQLPGLAHEQMIVEPEQRDTGPCTALTAHYFLQRQLDEVLVIVPSDQYVSDADAMMAAVENGEKAARTDGVIVTLGIVPSRPETGYGYMVAEDAPAGTVVQKVRKFIEKPPLDKARELLQQPNIYWNSGIFIWKPSTIARYMSVHQPMMWKDLSDNAHRLDEVYGQLPKLSVDYAILEKVDTIYTIPVRFVWDDVGTWSALERIFDKDANGNVIKGDIFHESMSNSIVHVEGQQAIIIGISDLIVVSTAEGLLVCHKSKEQQIKQLIASMEANKGGI